MNRQGKGFLQPDEPGLAEIVIPENETSTALHEDRVLVRRDVRPQGLRRPEPPATTGTVVRVLERRRTRFVGTLARGRQFFYVIPDDPRITHDIYVAPPGDDDRAPRVGEKVVVELKEWTSRHTNPEGEIVERLGAPEADGVDMLAVLRHYDLPLHFPRSVLKEAESFGSEIRESDLADRIDCRAHRVVTIDPDDARDFDDAICLERDGEGRWRLWVHIADVSHYVTPGSALDAEARRRGNSTYLVDRVIPMLPEALSNELCSLKPGVDRLTRCVEFLLSNDGRVLDARLGSAVIRSQRRFTYREALEILQRKPSDPIERMLHHAHELAQRLRRARFRAGSLELDLPEMKIRLDAQGRVARIERIENDVSHQLIEEFMLLANEAVAGRLMKRRTPAVYRVHEEPDPRRLQEYREEVLAHNVVCGNLQQRAEMQRLLHRLAGLAIGPALRIGFLKSLRRARYAAEPLGHYGLAKREYTHFTSPIRRYADLLVHRAAFDAPSPVAGQLQATAEHISTTERNSADAERDSKDVKLFAFLQRQLDSGRPESYPALVTDVRNFGVFVDVPGLAMSGVVPLAGLDDDFYVFDPIRNRLTGRRRRQVIRLGDRFDVQVSRVDRFRKQVDFRAATWGRAALHSRVPQRSSAPRSGAGARGMPAGPTVPDPRHRPGALPQRSASGARTARPPLPGNRNRNRGGGGGSDASKPRGPSRGPGPLRGRSGAGASRSPHGSQDPRRGARIEGRGRS